MPIAQATIPDGFSNLWRVGGWFDENEHAQKLCRALGYEADENGSHLVRVEFVDRTDLFDAKEALIHPHMLFPA
jgi:hypothetical protein